MSAYLISLLQQRHLKPSIRSATVLLAGFFVMASVSAAQAQTFDDEIRRALLGGCVAMGGVGGSFGPNLAALCAGISGTVTGSASSGSTTTLSRESTPVEEKRVERVMGPFNVFLSGEYERFDKDVTRFEPGYKTNTGRALIGADYSFSDRMLIGAALKYSRDNGRFDAGGHFDTDSYGGLIHAGLVPGSNSFIDISAGYTRKNYSLERIAVVSTQFGGTTRLGTIDSDTDGNEYKLGVNGGYNFRFQSVTFGPRVGVNYRRTEIEEFRESGRRIPGVGVPGPGTGLELIYRSQHENSLTTALGMFGSVAFSTGIGVLVPQAMAEYVHEFLDPQRKIRFRFAEDRNRTPFRFENDPPDRHYFNLGAGIVLVLPRGFSPFVNYRALVGYNDQRSHIVTAGLRVEF